MKLIKKKSFGMQLSLVVLVGILSIVGCGGKKKQAALWPLGLLGANQKDSVITPSNNGTSTAGTVGLATGSGTNNGASTPGTEGLTTGSGTNNGTFTPGTGNDGSGISGNENSNTSNLPTVTIPSIDFNSSYSFIREGNVNSATIPTQLRLTISTPVKSNTFVSITSSSPMSLSVVNNGATILTGETSAIIYLDGKIQNQSVTLSATFNDTQKTTIVRVVGIFETPQIISITPNTNAISIGNSVSLTANLDIPSSIGGTNLTLAVFPVENGTAPMLVTVPTDQTSVPFSFTAVSGGNATVTGTLGASFSSALVNIE